jgi:signal transduction histidine kinase
MGGVILVGYLAAGASAPGGVSALDGGTGVAAVERGATLAALGGAVLAARAGAARRDALGRRMRALAGDWKEQLLALERARGELLAHVSHELLTPLAAIRAGAGLLAEEAGGVEVEWVGDGRRTACPLPAAADAAARRRLARTVERNAVRLTVLVDDLLELARIEEERPELRPGWWPCGDLLRRAAEAVMPLCEARRQRLAWEVSPPGLAMWGDDRRIEQVLVNLLANANKYAGDGAQIVARAIGERGGVRLEVGDDGPGLPAGALDALFDRYYRGPGGPGRGSGLGLAIARALVELHGGAIWAESELEHGSRFCCRFPSPGAGEPARAEASRGGRA